LPKRRKQTKFAVLNPKAVRIPATTIRILKAGFAALSIKLRLIAALWQAPATYMIPSLI
jgi:hypothetical protein